MALPNPAPFHPFQEALTRWREPRLWSPTLPCAYSLERLQLPSGNSQSRFQQGQPRKPSPLLFSGERSIQKLLPCRCWGAAHLCLCVPAPTLRTYRIMTISAEEAKKGGGLWVGAALPRSRCPLPMNSLISPQRRSWGGVGLVEKMAPPQASVQVGLSYKPSFSTSSSSQELPPLPAPDQPCEVPVTAKAWHEVQMLWVTGVHWPQHPF